MLVHLFGFVLSIARDTFPSGDPVNRVKLLVGDDTVTVDFGYDREGRMAWTGGLPVAGDGVMVQARVSTYVTKRNTAGMNVRAVSVEPAPDLVNPLAATALAAS